MSETENLDTSHNLADATEGVEKPVKMLRPDEIPSELPELKKLDETLLGIFRSYRFQRGAGVLILAVALICLFGMILVTISLLLLPVGWVMYVYSTVNMGRHLRLLKRYKAVLETNGLSPTPVYLRAVKARTKVLISWGIATLPGLIFLIWYSRIL